MKWPPLSIEGNAKHSTDGDEIYHGTESLVKVNDRLWFDAKHPFVAHYILLRSWENQSPSTVPDKSIIFFLHRLNPLGILESLGDNAWFKDSWNYSGETIFWVRFLDEIFRAGLHGMMV